MSQLIRGLRDPAIAALLAQHAADVIEVLETALSFYANPGIYVPTSANVLTDDRGAIAIHVLQSIAAKDSHLFLLPVTTLTQ